MIGGRNMYDFLKPYSQDNPEKFNEEFIYMKRDDKVLDYMVDICKALEVIDGVKFLGAKLITDESQLKTRGKEGEKWIGLEESRLDTIDIKFRVTGDKEGEDEIIERSILFPKLINDFYYVLGGNKSYPIYQIIDLATYKTPKSLTLKTLLMPIVLRTYEETITDYNENEYTENIFILDLFKNKVNVLHYYFAKFGLEETIKMFGFTDHEIGIAGADEIDFDDNEEYILFKVSKHVVVYVANEVMEKSFNRRFVLMIVNMLNSRCTMDRVISREYWEKKLGMIFTKNPNSQADKAKKIIISFERILDDRTRKILRIDDKYKKNIYSIIEWMMTHYDTLITKDNMDLANKRIRVNEYLLHPLLIKFSTITYRLLNKPQVTFNQKKQLFSTLGPGFVIKKLKQNELLRYNNSVNGIDLFTSGLKFSQRGPQSMSEGGKSISIRYRGLHPSYVGRIGLTTSSSGDPGMTGTFSPFIQTEGFYFTKPDDEFLEEATNEKDTV